MGLFGIQWGSYRYNPLPGQDYKPVRKISRKQVGILLVIMVAAVIAVSAILFSLARGVAIPRNHSCQDVDVGYTCNPTISKFWGQYSPFFSVDSEIPDVVPEGCEITFAAILSRHGGRDPTSSKTTAYNKTVLQIQSNVKDYPEKYSFVKDFQYTLGADQLTTIGKQEMVDSGSKFAKRYRSLAEGNSPFVRSSGQQRVIDSAQGWIDGFHAQTPQETTPIIAVIISEEDGVNNTLSHALCTTFEDGYASTYGDDAQTKWADIFVPPIMDRLNADLAGANLTQTQTIYVMDLCPFVTIAEPTGQISDFCSLFTEDEWHQYDYYQSLGKYYGYGNGNPLGPTQGVGFTNELIARLTQTPVEDHTSSNSTLDDNNATFPLDRVLYADFSHDNDMTAIFAALELYNATAPLSNTSIESTEQTNGFSAAWTVPFGARAYFEKQSCLADASNARTEFVRVLVNDRVMPLQNCDADDLGRCSLDKWVNSLSFARSGGRWNECFDS